MTKTTSAPTISPAWLAFYQEAARLAALARQRREQAATSPRATQSERTGGAER